MTNGQFNDMVRHAQAELTHKSLTDVQVETAYKWAARACAAHYLGHIEDAVEYAHEAIEHAALSGDDAVLQRIRVLMGRGALPLTR
jgi:hypothetical protein